MTKEELKDRIKRQVKRYLPSIDVTNISINTSPELIDSNEASLTIEYYIKPLDLVGSMNIIADGWTEADDLLARSLQAEKVSNTLERETWYE